MLMPIVRYRLTTYRLRLFCNIDTQRLPLLFYVNADYNFETHNRVHYEPLLMGELNL